MKIATKPERCKQCELCFVNCPKDAISFSDDFNAFGYQYTVINNELCIGCGICYTMCPDGVYTVLG